MFFGVDGGGSSLAPHQLPNPPTRTHSTHTSRRFFTSDRNKTNRSNHTNRHIRSKSRNQPHHRASTSSSTYKTSNGGIRRGATTTQNSTSIRRSTPTPTYSPRSKFRSAEIECHIKLAESKSRRQRDTQYNRPMTTIPRASTSLGYVLDRHSKPKNTTTSSHRSTILPYELRQDCLELEEMAAAQDALKNVDDRLVHNAFDILTRMTNRMTSEVEQNVLRSISAIFKRAIYSHDVEDTRINENDHILIPTSKTNTTAIHNNTTNATINQVEEENQENKEINTIKNSETASTNIESMVGKVVRINTLTIDRALVPNAALLHGELGVIETSLPYINLQSDPETMENENSLFLCTVRIASGKSVQIKSSRLHIIENARGDVVVRTESSQESTQSKMIQENLGSSSTTISTDINNQPENSMYNTSNTFPSTSIQNMNSMNSMNSMKSMKSMKSVRNFSVWKGIPNYLLVDRLRASVLHLNEKCELYEHRLNGHRTARKNLRIEIESYKLKIIQKQEEKTLEIENHTITKTLSEKRR